MNGADAARQPLETDARKPGGGQPLRQRFRRGKPEHRLWQVGIGISMFRDQPADGGKNSPEIEEIDGPERREARNNNKTSGEALLRLAPRKTVASALAAKVTNWLVLAMNAS